MCSSDLVELKTTDNVRGDVLNIFGYQAFYSDYQKDLTEFRGSDKSFAADITYKRYQIGEKTKDKEEGTTEKYTALFDPYNSNADVLINDLKNAGKIVSTNQAPVRFKFNASPVSKASETAKYYKWDGKKWEAKNDERIIYTDPGIYLVQYDYYFDGYKYMADGNIVQEDRKSVGRERVC